MKIPKLGLIIPIVGMVLCVQAEEINPDQQAHNEAFCSAWAQDATQATEHRLQGTEPTRLEELIDAIPDDMLPPDAKLRAKSAIGFAYTYPMDMDTMYDIAYIRCRSCIDESDPEPCMRLFDSALQKMDIPEVDF